MRFPRDKDFVKPFAAYPQLEENTHGIPRIFFLILRWVFFQFKVLIDQFDLHLFSGLLVLAELELFLFSESVKESMSWY